MRLFRPFKKSFANSCNVGACVRFFVDGSSAANLSRYAVAAFMAARSVFSSVLPR